MKLDVFAIITILMAVLSFIFSAIIWFRFFKMKNIQAQKRDEQKIFQEYV
jgi:cellobiose-specific phosphotransferase system component IIC